MYEMADEQFRPPDAKERAEVRQILLGRLNARKLDIGALRELAEQATPGPWRTGWDGQEFYVRPESSTSIWDRVVEATFAIMPGNSDEQDDCDTQNLEFIAAWNPVTAKAVLDRLAEAEKIIATVRVARTEGWYEDNPRWDAVDAALAAYKEGTGQ